MLQGKSAKILSFTLIISILISLVFSTMYFTYASTNEEKLYLVEYNLETKEITTREYPNVNINTRNSIRSTESYIPTNVMPKARDITGGNDSRILVEDTTVFPNSAICYIETTFEDGTIGRGTAFLVYSNYAYTAGHCVYHEDYGAPVSIRVVPGKNSNTEPFGDTWVTNVEMDPGWMYDFDDDEDWAFLTLNTHIGNNTGWLGIAYSDDYSYFANDRVILNVIGYPKSLFRNYRQYSGFGPVMSASDMHLIYDIDTEEGQSGAPVIQGDHAIGIHTNWKRLNNTVYNECSNITRARFEGFLSKIN